MADFTTTTNSSDGLDVLAQAISEKIGNILEGRLFPTLLNEVEKKSKAALQTKETFTTKLQKFEKSFDEKGLLGIGFDYFKKGFKKDEKAPPIKQATDALKVPSVTPANEKLPAAMRDNKDFQQTISATDANIIEEVEEKPKTVILGGLTSDFEKKLPDILKDIFPKEKVEEKEEKTEYGEKGLLSMIPPWLLGIGGGLALVLGGITALVMAFKTDGGAKGTLETIGKLGLKGGLILLAKKVFGMTLKGALKKIPIIGTLLSYGFAFQRFSKGDTIGGIIDLVSGTVQLLDLVAPGLGTVLSLGVDIMQSILDAKAGGSSAEASAKKTGILLDWAKGLGSMLYKAAKYIPVLGPLMQSAEDMSNGKWLDATYNLVRAIPGVGTVLDIIDWLSGGKTQAAIKDNLSKSGTVGWVEGMSKWVAEKVMNLPIIGPLIKSSQALLAGQWKDSLIWLGRAVPFVSMIMDWLDVKTSAEQKDVKQEAPKKSPFTAIKEAIIEKARNWWKNTWSWVKWLARKVLPKNIIESLEGQVDDKLQGIDTPEGEIKVETNPLDNLKRLGGVVASNAKDYVKKVAEKVNNFAKSSILNTINNAQKLKEKISSLFGSGKEWLKEQSVAFQDTLKNVSESISDIRKWVHENITLKIANFIKDTVKRIFNWAKDALGNIVSKIGSFIAPSAINTTEQIQQHEQRLSDIETKLAAVTDQQKNKSIYKPQDLSPEEMKKWSDSAKNSVSISPETNQIRSAENYQQKEEKPINIAMEDRPVIDEKFLRDISDNTERTHMSLENLIRLMYKFTQVMDKKTTNGDQKTSNIFLGQQQQYETASRASATNFDPIRQIRSQFALDSV